jgi:hypothetical protein
MDPKINLEDLVITRYQIKQDLEKFSFDAPTFDRTTGPSYTGVKWAVRKSGTVLTNEGDWEYESSPSNRDDDFYTRCRFDSLEEAVNKYNNTTKHT